MTQSATEATAETAGETSADTSTAAASTTTTTEAAATAATVEAGSTEGEQALGDAGKKALDAMKAKWKDADKLAKENAAALAALQAKLDGKEKEHAAEQAKREAEQAVLAKANDRIRKSEIKAAAKGVLADPQDAYKFLDLEQFEVDADGNVDEDAIAKALADLVKTKPYLAVQDGKRFQGAADAGTRNESRPAQLTRADLARMTPQDIEKARIDGRLNDVLGIKT